MSFELCASLACVVGLCTAARAECLVARSAFASVFGQVNGRHRGHDLAIVILSVVVYFSWLHLHGVTTWTGNQVLVPLHILLELKVVYFFELFLLEVELQFLFLDGLLAHRAVDKLLVHEAIERGFLEAALVHHVPALCRLQHDLVWAVEDVFVAELADWNFSFSRAFLEETLLLFDDVAGADLVGVER